MYTSIQSYFALFLRKKCDVVTGVCFVRAGRPCINLLDERAACVDEALVKGSCGFALGGSGVRKILRRSTVTTPLQDCSWLRTAAIFAVWLRDRCSSEG